MLFDITSTISHKHFNLTLAYESVSSIKWIITLEKLLSMTLSSPILLNYLSLFYINQAPTVQDINKVEDFLQNVYSRELNFTLIKH
jgi:hypothetical protein